MKLSLSALALAGALIGTSGVAMADDHRRDRHVVKERVVYIEHAPRPRLRASRSYREQLRKQRRAERRFERRLNRRLNRDHIYRREARRLDPCDYRYRGARVYYRAY
ncbi:MAG: hypothetical protein AAGA84_10900 [Pseudomonadota bacterium]